MLSSLYQPSIDNPPSPLQKNYVIKQPCIRFWFLDTSNIFIIYVGTQKCFLCEKTYKCLTCKILTKLNHGWNIILVLTLENGDVYAILTWFQYLWSLLVVHAAKKIIGYSSLLSYTFCSFIIHFFLCNCVIFFIQGITFTEWAFINPSQKV